MPKHNDIDKVMIIGSGPIIIGQACEFDYSGTQACKALRSLGYKIVLANSNPETVSTDYDTSNKLYYEPLTVEDILSIYEKEKPEGVIVQFGGQTPLNLAAELAAAKGIAACRNGREQCKSLQSYHADIT